MPIFAHFLYENIPKNRVGVLWLGGYRVQGLHWGRKSLPPVISVRMDIAAARRFPFCPCSCWPVILAWFPGPKMGCTLLTFHFYQLKKLGRLTPVEYEIALLPFACFSAISNIGFNFSYCTIFMYCYCGNFRHSNNIIIVIAILNTHSA